ncbi:hypothetical protein Q9K01_05865 [Qipengyuania sp. DY56-A-20]|jgi:hypothetical protein|uniref:Curlin associated repeat-containing protein n=1 Tax=Qipengyuania benthica TaxID=3067651 RepID=A0ABT9H750_9SPHN|nr:hypothetical protein [Qipengyuania sp. DY56-A-20]MDP4539145.1 hypothetical protein [Qipengyuania sp. DY56-A-20]
MRSVFPLLGGIATLILLLAPSAAIAGDGNRDGTDKGAKEHVPPGNPCGDGPGVGKGNPCGGQPGNTGLQGNAGNRDINGRDDDPAPFTVVRGGGSGAFITQIGEDNWATIRQSRNSQYTWIDQDGARNLAAATQTGTGAHYALVEQTGDDNQATLTQSGESTQIAYLLQNGASNLMTVTQNEGLLPSGVEAVQMGDSNTMSLTQNGENNMARLTQAGSDNDMTAVQNGNNQLTWTQTGSGLSDLQITQPAGQVLLVTQSR